MAALKYLLGLTDVSVPPPLHKRQSSIVILLFYFTAIFSIIADVAV